MRKKKPFHVALFPDIHKKIKVLAVLYSVDPGDVITALVNLLQTVEEMEGDPDLQKRVRAIFETCLLNVDVEARFEGEQDSTEAVEERERVRGIREAMKRVSDQRAKER